MMEVNLWAEAFGTWPLCLSLYADHLDLLPQYRWLLRAPMARNLCVFLDFATFTYSEYACGCKISGKRKSHAPLCRSLRHR